MEIFTIVGLLTSYFRYRNAKAEGIDTEPEAILEPFELKPLAPDATLLQRVAHWLGLEEA